LAYPDYYRQHLARGGELSEFHEKEGTALDLQARGEYLYAACGEEGFYAFDIANIDQKGFSERILTAPVSPLGQKFYVRTKYATAVASPATLAVDPTRRHLPENEEAIYRDDKQPIHPLYGYIYVTDRYEGLILVGAATLLDGDPRNNFLKRALTFNPNGILAGANNITVAGTYAYVTCNRGLVVINIDDPLKPQIVTEIGAPLIRTPRA